jgi:LysM repeat protein
VLAAAAEKSRALEDERRVLLTKLLGTNWEAGDIASLPRPTRAGMILDGPILGQLSPDTKEAVLDVSLRSQDHLQAYLDAQHAAGKNPDPAEVARLRRETRTELSKVLTAPQLEEFLLRYSQNASDLRASFGTLEYFDASPEEFRAVFRATDQIDEQLQALGDAADANSAQQRKNLLAQRENEIKNALGASRYEDYSMLQDPLYRQAVAQADAAGTPDAVRAIYQVNLAALAEADSITNDANLSTQQKDVAMKNLQLQQAQANTLAVGQDLPLDQTTPPQQPPRRLHQLRPGDSASVVALMYGLPVSALRAANPNVDFNRLRAGDSIVIPPSPLTSGP